MRPRDMTQERRSTTPVSDERAERGLSVSNILQTLIALGIAGTVALLLTISNQLAVLVANYGTLSSQMYDHEGRLRIVERITIKHLREDGMIDK